MIRNISHNLKTANVEVDITGRDGTKIPAIVDVVNENRVSIVVDTLYTGVTVTVTVRCLSGRILLSLPVRTR